jgi:hypothetical protein
MERIEIRDHTEGPASPVLLRVSLATVLFLAIFASAAVLRLAELGVLPLSPDEAETSHIAWSFWHEAGGSSAAAHVVSPGYFASTAPFVALAGSSTNISFADALMRFAPALAGLLLILVVWLASDELGLLASLTTAALLAISPIGALAARTASGDSLALLAIVLIVASALRYRTGGGRHWPLVAAVAFGSGLTSSPLFYSGALTLVLASLAQGRFGRALAGYDGRELAWRRIALTATISFAAVATFFLWRPAGLGGAAAVLSRWLAAFSIPGDLPALAQPLFVLGRYELVAVTLGAAALLWAVWRGYPSPQFFVYWYVAAFLLLLAQPGVVTNVVLLALPAYFLIGQWIQDAFSRPAGEATWGVLAFVLLVGLVVHFNGIRFLRLMAGEQDVRSYVVIIALVLAFAAVTINLVRSWDARGALQGTLLGLLLLFGFYGWGTAWWLTHEAANDPRAGLALPATDSDVRLLVTILSEVSYQTGYGPYNLPLLAAVDTPVLRWYLRHFHATQFGETVPPATTTTAIITAASAPQPPVDDYASLNLGLANTGVTRGEQAPAASAGETLRWWLFRESRERVAQEEVILWVRQPALPWNR